MLTVMNALLGFELKIKLYETLKTLYYSFEASTFEDGANWTNPSSHSVCSSHIQWGKFTYWLQFFHWLAIIFWELCTWTSSERLLDSIFRCTTEFLDRLREGKWNLHISQLQGCETSNCHDCS